MLSWGELDIFFRDTTEDTLLATGEVMPCLAAFAGQRGLLLADLRPFEKGRYAEPLIELLALALPLGADRLAVAFGGRAWSLDDPPTPMVPGDPDLRQRILTIHRADGAGLRVRSEAVMWPFELADGAVTWHPPLHTDEAVAGWIPEALNKAVEHRERLGQPAEVALAQAERCARLGHRVHLSPEVGERLAELQQAVARGSDAEGRR